MNTAIQKLVCSVVCFVRFSLPVIKSMNKKQQFILPPDYFPVGFACASIFLIECAHARLAPKFTLRCLFNVQ